MTNSFEGESKKPENPEYNPEDSQNPDLEDIKNPDNIELSNSDQENIEDKNKIKEIKNKIFNLETTLLSFKQIRENNNEEIKNILDSSGIIDENINTLVKDENFFESINKLFEEKITEEEKKFKKDKEKIGRLKAYQEMIKNKFTHTIELKQIIKDQEEEIKTLKNDLK